jgi:chemotaxis protein MotB
MARDPLGPPPVPAREARETPGKTRGFPLRLWLYALVMTGAAGGIGYFAWNLRSDHVKATTAQAACEKDLTPTRDNLRATGDKLRTCEDDLGKTSAKQKENDDQLVKMQSNLSATKDELTALRAQRVEIEKRMAAIADIQAQFAKMIDTGQLKVASRRGSLVVELPAEVLFPSGSAELSEKGDIAVLEVGFILKRFPDRRFLVVGHTDNVPLKSSTMRDNWELSAARALTVTRVLVKAGMKPDSLVPAGVGEHDPVTPNASSGDRQRNRRIEIQLLPAITELPPLPATLGEVAPKP